MANVLDVPYGQLGDLTQRHPTTICVETLDTHLPQGAPQPQTTTYKQASRFVNLTQTTGPGGRRGVEARPSVFAEKTQYVTARDETFGKWETESIPRGTTLPNVLTMVVARNKKDPKEPILRIKIRMSDSSEINFARKNPKQPGTLKFTSFYSPSEATDNAFVEKFGGTVRPPNDSSRRIPQLPHMKNLDMPTKMELKSMFQRFDFNGNGMLSFAEVDKAIKEYWPHFNNKHVLIRAFNAADENGTGYVGRLEFEFMIRFIIGYTKAMRQFTKVDTSADNRISLNEFMAACREIDDPKGIPSSSSSSSPADMKVAFQKLDKNGGGYILFEEFCAYFAANNADTQIQLSGSDVNGIRQRRESSKKKSVQPKGLRVEAIAIPDMKKAHQLFDRCDMNGNSALSLAELDKAVVELWPSLNNKPALMRAYKAADKNGTGLVGRKEFGFFLQYVVTYNNLWARFKEIDTNGDRRVGAQEFSTAAKSLGIATETQAKIAFRQIDANGGGVVLFDEFCNWMTEVKMGINNPTDGCNLSGMDYADTKANQQAAIQYGRRSGTPSVSVASNVSSSRNNSNAGSGGGVAPLAGRRASGKSGGTTSGFVAPSRDDIKRLFNRTDVNGNGILSLAELDKAVVEIWPHFNHKPALMRAYKAADKNKTGFVGKSEFELFIKFIPMFTEIWDTFQSMDPNGDRRLSKAEFIQAASMLKLGNIASDAQLGQLFDTADSNSGGFLLFDEFCGLITSIKMTQLV